MLVCALQHMSGCLKNFRWNIFIINQVYLYVCYLSDNLLYIFSPLFVINQAVFLLHKWEYHSFYNIIVSTRTNADVSNILVADLPIMLYFLACHFNAINGELSTAIYVHINVTFEPIVIQEVQFASYPLTKGISGTRLYTNIPLTLTGRQVSMLSYVVINHRVKIITLIWICNLPQWGVKRCPPWVSAWWPTDQASWWG